MMNFTADALVFFGATGDLAYKKIFPALQGMVSRGHLNVPVIGVAKAGGTLDQFKARARDSVEKHGGIDPRRSPSCAAPAICRRRLQGSRHFTRLRKELGSAQRPAHYLAIPPVLFALVVEQLVQRRAAPTALASSSKSRSDETCLGAGLQPYLARQLQ